ncbi:hypothetical protein [Sphingobacterium pedocola]|uniref:Uncharacterized protein n=1 Tax=Sphingobacterium pedocola TaxID=2082722 RepID=A0ABR9TBG8_9SPHI|nr:hypothetical protein [Sphingobacterium pedocola]MBE8722717.1 hypothetical protein [Sphingobacterium pedocola]
MKKLFPLLSLLSILSACTKEEVSKYPYQTTFDAIVPVSEMRFFVGGTELNPDHHEKTVMGFLDRLYSEKTNTGYISYWSKFTEQDPDWFADSYFIFEGKDIIKYSAFSEITDVTETGDATVLKSSATNQVEDDPIVKSNLFKYDINLNPNGSYNIQLVVHNRERTLEVSRLYYKLVRYDKSGNRTALSFGTVSNEFNELFIKTMTERDTLAIKEYRLTYSIK